jgi:hypothetical protein
MPIYLFYQGIDSVGQLTAARRTPATISHLARLGVSSLGAHESLDGQIVTNPADRERPAQIVAAALGRPSKRRGLQ